MAMIPNNNMPVGSDFPDILVVERVDNTYHINENGTVYGFIRGKEALRQWVVSCLSTERYKYPIYSWNFGLETEDLYGQNPQYVMAVLEHRIKEALSVDSRILRVYAYEAHPEGKKVHVRFMLMTVFDNELFEHTIEDVL